MITIKTALFLFIPIASLVIGFGVFSYQFQLNKEKQRVAQVTKIQLEALANSLDVKLGIFHLRVNTLEY